MNVTCALADDGISISFDMQILPGEEEKGKEEDNSKGRGTNDRLFDIDIDDNDIEGDGAQARSGWAK